jgi:FixJ family two-component response regulator
MTTHRCEEACRGYCVRPDNKSESFGSASDFLAREQHPGPACVVVDVRMPGLNGMDLQNDGAAPRELKPAVCWIY